MTFAAELLTSRGTTVRRIVLGCARRPSLRKARLHLIDFSGREPDPLYVLLDFLVGDSVDTLARKNGLDARRIESVLRRALAAYGFNGAEPASSEPRIAREG